MIEYDLPLKCENHNCINGVIHVSPELYRHLGRMTMQCDCKGVFSKSIELEKKDE